MFAAAKRLIAIPLVASILCLSLSVAASTCKPEIRRNNILANALFTTLFRTMNGEVDSWSDVGESMFFGGTAGYLFYKSRVMIGDGQENLGLATAYLASSISENTTYGEHPLAYLRMGIGPIDFRVTTRWAGEQKSKLSIGVNTIDAIGLLGVVATGKADDFKIRNTVVTGIDRGIIDGDYDGYTVGRTVYLDEAEQSDPGLWRHELIHVTQYLQYSSFGSLGYNPFDLDRYSRFKEQQSSSVGMHVRIEWFNSLVTHLDQSRDYGDRWMETEAARIAQNTSPLHNSHDNVCSSQVGFQFKF